MKQLLVEVPGAKIRVELVIEGTINQRDSWRRVLAGEDAPTADITTLLNH